VKTGESEWERDTDIGITARDCGEPREIEYANEEEWPPNSRQVLYYFFAVSFGFEVNRRKKKRKDESRKRISSVKRREISSRNRLSLGDEWKTRRNTLLNTFKSFHQTVKTYRHTRIFRTIWERARNKKIINFSAPPPLFLSFSHDFLP